MPANALKYASLVAQPKAKKKGKGKAKGQGNVNDLLLGSSGQHAVAAELLHRRYNVAVPIVDDGTDLLVLGPSGTTRRVQVKTSSAIGKKKPYSVLFGGLRRTDLTQPPTKDVLHYALMIRVEEGWWQALLINQSELGHLYATYLSQTNRGPGKGYTMGVRLAVESNDQKIWSQSVKPFWNCWDSAWPRL
jgi:hypothetical protein